MKFRLPSEEARSCRSVFEALLSLFHNTASFLWPSSTDGVVGVTFAPALFGRIAPAARASHSRRRSDEAPQMDDRVPRSILSLQQMGDKPDLEHTE